MPLYKEWNPDLNSVAAIWHITETEAFFTDRINLKSSHIHHSKRRIEFLAGRFLLQLLHKNFPLDRIFIDEHNKPQLPDHSVHFSISHSYPYVACVLNKVSPVGIDIQCWHHNIEMLQHKFLSPTEQAFCANNAQKITLAWSSKEAAYKCQGRRGVDFIQHLPIISWDENSDFYDIKINLQIISRSQEIRVKSFIFNDFSLSLTTE